MTFWKFYDVLYIRKPRANIKSKIKIKLRVKVKLIIRFKTKIAIFKVRVEAKLAI